MISKTPIDRRKHLVLPIHLYITRLKFLALHQQFRSSIVSDSNDKFFEWNFAPKEENVGVVGDNGPVVTVVLLGWLGANPKHLRRYVELYNSRGIHAVTFVASVKDVLWFDLGRKLQQRISALAHDLGSWLGESERDGRERLLIFHTFSNTGWLAYGAILDNLQGRQDVLMKIKGCVVDSGGDPEINPKVWAAGFTAALLKKRSYSAYPPSEAREGLESETSLSKMQQTEPLLIETILLVAFEKLFFFVLNLPDIKQRLTKVISTLSRNQPLCPQLYLYSTADKVIPSQSVELFVEKQRREGRKRIRNISVDWYRNGQLTSNLDLLCSRAISDGMGSGFTCALAKLTGRKVTNVSCEEQILGLKFLVGGQPDEKFDSRVGSNFPYPVPVWEGNGSWGCGHGMYVPKQGNQVWLRFQIAFPVGEKCHAYWTK
ncbi:hypothetical protein Acr_07g0004140 [Actinidia rufa]|uniref:Alpha/beta-Hydrolases superfamily protein n=1 Tax=Actinidia rufa TaxID=165716 RepID=A0A7J0EX88_9ERIC|nr:hypothetical protein Acr_07g0004140 [Actinidia rufa]